jgi:Fic family protein
MPRPAATPKRTAARKTAQKSGAKQAPARKKSPARKTTAGKAPPRKTAKKTSKKAARKKAPARQPASRKKSASKTAKKTAKKAVKQVAKPTANPTASGATPLTATKLPPLTSLSPSRFKTVDILELQTSAARSLAELKGVVQAIPNQRMLINTLGLQDAKESSEIENIFTSLASLFTGDAGQPDVVDPATKEVLRYRDALDAGYRLLRERGLITTATLVAIQRELVQNEAGIRRQPGTVISDSAGRVVYTPPQEYDQIVPLLAELEQFINDDSLFQADPLVKMALIHWQFEAIHPFYDGNGRTGRILNVLFLVQKGLLGIPVLYLSRYIVEHKAEYYRLLQTVRTEDAWEDWVTYMLSAVESTARRTIVTIGQIRDALRDLKTLIRTDFHFYSQDLVNNLFTHPYTTVAYIERDLKVSRPTATRYLESLVDAGILHRRRAGRTNLYINHRLEAILTAISESPADQPASDAILAPRPPKSEPT